jgi:hypothetical protein
LASHPRGRVSAGAVSAMLRNCSSELRSRADYVSKDIVFYDQLPYAEAEENLALWVSSDGKRLPNRRVRVKAKRINDAIHALIIPI